jgi:dihydrofolate synthase/folylpolyglutamate synthase
MSRFKTVEDVWSFLDAIPMFQKSGTSAANFSLNNIRSFCDALGNLQDKFPSIHVAGTNGKGTTCYLLEKIYSDEGYKTGLFTSPHLLRYNERVRVGQQEITDQQLLEFFQSADELFDKIKLSYFEISTALAFWFFAKQEVDIAIIETGLGGRLDSTNIITPELSVITSIGLDHQNVLGDTLEEIAREKAGIIKEGKPVVMGNIPDPALSEIQQIAEKNKSKILLTDELNPEWESSVVTLNNGGVTMNTTFREAINKWNIAIVWQVVDELRSSFSVDPKSFKKSIEDFKGAPGRFEKLHPKYEWYFSGSHNIQALESSLRAVEAMNPRSESVLVFSAMKDKLSPELMSFFEGFKQTYFIEQEGERAAKFEDIGTHITAELVTEDDKEIILKELKTELVIFMGSFYFYPIVKRWTTNVS